jgi:hypothetical protein
VSWNAPNDGSKKLGLPYFKGSTTSGPVVSTLEPCMGASKSKTIGFLHARDERCSRS